MYIGRLFNVSAHRTGVAVFCCSVDGSIELALDPLRPDAGIVQCRTLLVPAGTPHFIRFNAEPIACFYLDPQSADVERIARGMTRIDGAFTTNHAREADIVTLLAKAGRVNMESNVLYQQLAQLLNLAPTAPLDERVARAIARIRTSPHETHSLAALAREVGLSPSRLQHLFTTCTGVPLRRFRIWNRMGAAIGAAAAGKTLTEAAHHAGFSSAAHFSSAFRAMFGLAPSDLVRARLELIVLGSESAPRSPSPRDRVSR